MPRHDLADVLATTRATVGGGATIGATVFFVVALVARDLRGAQHVDVLRWSEWGGGFGGLFALAVVFVRAVGL